jgi:hypothetical protein
VFKESIQAQVTKLEKNPVSFLPFYVVHLYIGDKALTKVEKSKYNSLNRKVKSGFKLEADTETMNLEREDLDSEEEDQTLDDTTRRRKTRATQPEKKLEAKEKEPAPVWEENLGETSTWKSFKPEIGGDKGGLHE